VLLLGGDIFDETTSDQDVELVRELLEEIDPPEYGIYYVYGNHDDPDTGWAAEQMRSMGAEVLDDRMVLLGEDIQLIGHHDPTHSDLTGPELLNRLEIDDTKPVLVLTHRPKEFADMAEQGADLALAGHTHGFNIPFFLGGPAFNDMYYGIRSYGNMTAITTSGVSAWGWHYKWPAISEIVRIELQFAE
jgi:predicted MPP superfamily phosphohydrolase